MTQIELKSSKFQNGFGYAVLACICIVITAAYWHAQNLGGGDLWRYDEFYTHDRTLGFAAFQDWFTVYSLGKPSLEKPPLQYWMSAGLIQAGLTDLIALRIPSLIFAAGAMIATAALAYVMFPRQVWLMPISVLLLSTSDQFWQYSTSAMLDAGAVFFVTLGVLSLFLSLKNPRYWPTFPITVFLAGLQKGPTPLGFLLIALIGVALTSRFHGDKLRDIARNRRFQYSVLAAFFLGFIWQIFQHAKYWGQDRLSGSIEGEMINRFIPENLEFVSRTISGFDTLILYDEPVIRLAGLAGLLMIPFIYRTSAYLAMSSIAILFVLIMILAQDSVYDRYTLTILPLLCVGAAWLIFYICRRPVIGCVAAVLVVVALGGPLRPVEVLAQSKSRDYGMPIAEILGQLNDSFESGETAIFCRLENRNFPRGAVHVHAPKAGPGQHIYLRSVDSLTRDMRKYKGGRIRGLCLKSEIDLLSPHFEGVTTEPVGGGFHIWTASRYRQAISE
ncbi:hypothetical protein [Ruegeria conchae]|uniref:ArnT family glycosyltransferase n=1 Tax=Ruegeria conchae TaxID=981384 RepID=UPI0029C69C37|nr:hypothetical protein [Ruegeria conchae]